MGAFDLAAPFLSRADALFPWAPAWLHVVLWGAISGGVTMGLYALTSCQPCIARVKQELQPLRAALAHYDGEAAGLLPLVRRALGLSLRQIGLTAYPAFLASIPLLFVIAWLNIAYGHAYPAPGTPVTVRVMDRDGATDTKTIPWPSDRRVEVRHGNEIIQVTFHEPVPVLSKRTGWDLLFGNPNGYLADGARISRIEFGLPPRELLNTGPSWMRGWAFVYFTTLVLSALAIKLAFRIQ